MFSALRMMDWTAPVLMFVLCWLIPWKQNNTIPRGEYFSSISSCDIVVDAGPDTNVCDPGGLITLMGSIEGDHLLTIWSPASALSNPNILNPVANVTDPITYTLTGWAIDPDSTSLIINGDFQLGNVGFSSDYTYYPDIVGQQNELIQEGTYTVIDDPNLVHTGFAACNDHTDGNGNMMVVNGAGTLQNVWCQTIAVAPDSYYNVSAWVASVSSGSPAILRFSINNIQIGNIVYALNSTCVWIPFNATWYSGNATTADICIVNLNTALGGNDFALDDISFVPLCSVSDEVEITLYQEEAPEPEIEGPVFICAGDVAQYTADFPSEPPILNCQWTVPSGALILTGQGTPQITVRLDDAQEGEICLTIETRCDTEEGCLDITVGDVPEQPFITGTINLCPGETGFLYTPELDPDDVYNWILSPEIIVIGGDGTNELEIEWAQSGEAEICLEVTNACGTNDNCILLNLLPGYQTVYDTILCVGTTVTINGTVYGNGLWSGTENFTSTDGCDSIVQVEISEASTLEFMVTEHLCPGDSVFAQGAFQTQPGMYVDSFVTTANCDSLVITEIFILYPDTTLMTGYTCDPLLAGTSSITISGTNCDSTVITQVILQASDTTIIDLYSCLPTDTGQTILMLTNIAGCDSVIIYTTSLLNSDTILFYLNTCDPSQVGVTMQSYINADGCDSTVITDVSFLQSDTTYIASYACDLSDTGTTSTLLINSSGCDSLVLNEVLYGGSDTTFIQSTTCIPAEAGIVITGLINAQGCDSLIHQHTQLILSDTTYLNSASCFPQDTGLHLLTLTNAAGCDSFVITTTSLSSPDDCSLEVSYLVQQPLCYGDSARITIDILSGLSPFTLNAVNMGMQDNFDFPDKGQFTFPIGLTGQVVLQLFSANGLQIIDSVFIDSPLPLLIETKSRDDFSGFGVPCYNDSIGQIETTIVSEGTLPLSFIWSNGMNLPNISGLHAGIYEVTVTDKNGCTTISNSEITQPPLISYEIDASGIDCFGNNNGTISITPQGGVPPFETSIDNSSFQNELFYNELIAGAYNVVIRDQNGCSFDQQIIISQANDWTIDLGKDTTIAFGLDFEIVAEVIGLPAGALDFSWSDGMCINCQSRTIDGFASATYDVTAIDENGCIAMDDIRITVLIDRAMYIPTVFSPNGDQVNDEFLISAGLFVDLLEEILIYDRWGNLVFQKNNFLPNDPLSSWDGSMKNKTLNSGVYTYILAVRFRDGIREVRTGNVTLIR